jgi:hypothetical protein
MVCEEVVNWYNVEDGVQPWWTWLVDGGATRGGRTLSEMHGNQSVTV